MLHLIGSDVLALMKYYILCISGLNANIYLESSGVRFFFLLHWQLKQQQVSSANFLLPQQTSRFQMCLGQHWLPRGLFFHPKFGVSDTLAFRPELCREPLCLFWGTVWVIMTKGYLFFESLDWSNSFLNGR